jgi:transcriptional regulator with XRE-family HTH domain
MSTIIHGYGEMIKQARLELNLTQRQVADQCGITDSALAHIERELRLPSEPVSDRISKALGFTQKRRSEFKSKLKSARELQASKRWEKKRAGFKWVAGDATDAEDLVRALTSDPELLQGCRDLRLALSKRSQRKAVLRALKAWASES